MGRMNEYKIVDKTHFGPRPNVKVGESWLLRMQVSEAGMHHPQVAGIASTAEEGCPSLILRGGYKDNMDDRDEFTYTGSGVQDLSANKRATPQSFDQELTRTNTALKKNCKAKIDNIKGGEAKDKWREGQPIRVIRGYKGRKHSRYNGLYKVVKYLPQ